MASFTPCVCFVVPIEKATLVATINIKAGPANNQGGDEKGMFLTAV